MFLIKLNFLKSRDVYSSFYRNTFSIEGLNNVFEFIYVLENKIPV